jgi:MoaA/NifB/PqqE/SkfB family radical SAM enzyme
MAVEIAPPQQITICPTRKCNYACVHCDRPLDPNAPTAPVEMIRRAIEDLHAQFGKRWITFAGGEPLLYEGLVESIRAVRPYSEGVNIVTNGSLMTKALAAELGDAGLDDYVLSLDGFKQQHDAIRKPGAYDRAMEGLEILRTELPAINVGVVCVIQRSNVSRLLDFAHRILDTPGISFLVFQAFVSHLAHERDRDWYLRNPVWPEFDGTLTNQLDALSELAANDSRVKTTPFQLQCMKLYFEDPTRFFFDKCEAWRRMMIIEANGDVKLCPALGPIGNLHESSFEQIWNSPENEKALARTVTCRQVCHLVVNCGFTPGSLVEIEALI